MARVVGTVVSTIKHETYRNFKCCSTERLF